MTVKMPRQSDRILAAMDWRAMITLAAFILALATAAARCTLLETVRESFSPAATPRGPGAVSSLALDLLCCLPAILVLLRRAVDETYILRFTWSHLLILPLAIWMAVSFGWADDKFAALISTANFIAAVALLWAMSQLVRSWLRLRMVTAVVFGLLLAFLVQGFFWKMVEFPDVKTEFLKHRDQSLRQQGYEPGTFIAAQFETRVLSGELMGFNSSPNSFAAMLVLLMTIATGAIIQRIADRDSREWAIGLSLVLPAAAAVLMFTGSKAALVSVILAGLFLLCIAKGRPLFVRYSRRAYWLAVLILLLEFAALIGHGLYWQTLPTASLNFRWRYWVASWRMFRLHPILGVGWSNFGLYYLSARLPAASEEIQDPHNFIVRFFVELGAVGGLLLLAWLMRIWWEMTRPVSPVAMASISRDTARAIRWIFAIALLMIGINIIASVDFTQSGNFLIIEMLKRGLYLCAMILGGLVVALRRVDAPDVDDRPAPWMLYAILVALGVFLIHNLIEFSIFEPGPLCFFCVLAGAVLGVRQVNHVAHRPRSKRLAIGSLSLAGGLWLLAILFIFIPTWRAEAAAHAGDDAQRDARPEDAAKKYQQAFSILPINAEYAFRAARALDLQMELMKMRNVASIPEDVWRPILDWYSIAIDRNPSFIKAYLSRARLQLQLMNRNGVVADFTKALSLDPHEVSIRIEFGRALARLAMPVNAASQLRSALRANDRLDAAEPKRLSAAQVEQIRQEIESLSGK
jgi:O-antigen ligase